MHQLLRFISPKIGQQIHLTGSRYHLWRDIWHMFHLHSDIKIAEGAFKMKTSRLCIFRNLIISTHIFLHKALISCEMLYSVRKFAFEK